MNVWKLIQERDRVSLPKLSSLEWVPPASDRPALWAADCRSRLIESFLINAPVPPLYTFAIDGFKSVMMDGFERLRAVRDFYDNALILSGLAARDDLNGRSHNQLDYTDRQDLSRRKADVWTVHCVPTNGVDGGAFQHFCAIGGPTTLYEVLRIRLNLIRNPIPPTVKDNDR